MRNRSSVTFWRPAAGMAVATLILCFWSAAVSAQGGEPGDVTQAPDPENRNCGIVVYDWNGPVEKKHHGFPSEQPPRENFNWNQPVNYAAGELFFRAEILSQPQPQKMNLQLCFWQPENGAGFIYKLETCGYMRVVEGNSGQVVTWSEKVAEMWKKDRIGVNWREPRSRASVAIKNINGRPVSDYNRWNWNGEDPAKWYPLQMRFTAVAVPQGGEFCGWDHYFTPSAVQMASFDASSPVESWHLPVVVTIVLVLLVGLTLHFIRRTRQL